ncbi:mechanosensitive ion channel family protein [Lutibacter citreus]|uniref:mechanosensitive ion channel family protein n=1 Tax=Lutibacter citreus TaxID=2138210 RepID=UPI000DBE58DB|nr:mechanosensitive ion channel domain-containing protein [Lutibacter citreus]
MEDQLKELLYNPTVGKIATILIGIIIIWFVIKAIQKKFISKLKNSNHRYKTKKISTFAGYLFSILLIAIIYSNKLGGFTIALGVAGAGIAFALQEVIASFAGWLAILFGGFYKTGDRVQLGGIKGDVMDIGVLRTTVMEIGQWVDGDLYNGRIVLIANSFIFKEPVFNYSGDFPFLWDEIKIPIQYGSNYEKAKILFIEIAKKTVGDLTNVSQEKWNALQKEFLLENAQTEPMVTLVANDNWVEFTLRYVVHFRKRRLTKSELFTQILTEVEKTNGEIKFASATFQLVETPDFNVNISNKT